MTLNRFINKRKYPLLLICFLFFSNTFAAPKLDYVLSMSNPHTHYFEVEMKIQDLKQDFVDLKMPTWAPGSYLIREFSRNVEGLDAKRTTGQQLPVKKISKNTWRVNTKNIKDITIHYQVYAFEMSVRTSFLDASHGYINGTSVFLYPDKMLDLPSTLTIIPYDAWKVVSTALPEVAGQQWVYRAQNYDILADSPIEIGNHEVFEFTAAGIPHQVAMYGEGNYDQQKLTNDLTKIVEACTQVYGDNPNENYLFIIHNLTKGSGGLEHLNSTTLQVNRWTYKPQSSYLGFLNLATHEYFHLWNVKRVRPLELGPFDYENENYNRLLWVMEGFTSYYDKLLITAANLADDRYFLSKIVGAINSIENQPGNKVQPVAEASFDAWIKSYRPDENSPNTTISYYTKGSVLAALLDLEILQSTNGNKNLDDVMQFLYNEYYKKQKRGITDVEFQVAVENIAGKKMQDFFQDHVHDSKPIDYNSYFQHAGLKLVDYNEGDETPVLGISTEDKGGKLMVRNVFRETAAHEGGINVNDEIIAIDGFRTDLTELNNIILMRNPGDSVSITVARDGKIKELNIILKSDDSVSLRFTALDKVSDQQRSIYNKWTRTTKKGS
ncbi:MAG: PDZ domain-containing protein [Bacteroidota bacterium]|nr:PDZ domain-containing protein [Bacteroidota bacterium]